MTIRIAPLLALLVGCGTAGSPRGPAEVGFRDDFDTEEPGRWGRVIDVRDGKLFPTDFVDYGPAVREARVGESWELSVGLGWVKEVERGPIISVMVVGPPHRGSNRVPHVRWQAGFDYRKRLWRVRVNGPERGHTLAKGGFADMGYSPGGVTVFRLSHAYGILSLHANDSLVYRDSVEGVLPDEVGGQNATEGRYVALFFTAAEATDDAVYFDWVEIRRSTADPCPPHVTCERIGRQ